MKRLSDIDLNALMIFQTVVEQGSIQKAKDILGRTQPAITLRLNKLEHEIGKKLFLLKKPMLKLTLEGEAVYKWALALKKHMQRSPMVRHNGFTDFHYPLRVGTYTYISAYSLALPMRETSDAYPELVFQTVFDDPFDLFQKLKNGMLDVVIMPKHFNPSHEIVKAFSIPQKFIALIPRSMHGMPMQQLKWCYYQNPKDLLLQTLNNVLLELVPQPDVRWEISKLTSVVSAIEMQFAAAIVPSFALCQGTHHAEAVQVTSHTCREIPLEAYIRRDFEKLPTAKALQFFCERLKAHLEAAIQRETLVDHLGLNA